MLNTFKSFLIMAFFLGLITGCSTNQPVDQVDTGIETETETYEPEPVEETVEEPVIEEPVVEVDTIFYFEFDSALLTPEARAALLVHAEQLATAPRPIRLEGHADERGSREYNIALGERRANAVRDFLVFQGVNASYIETISYGEERPADASSNEEAWSVNRRVELK